MAIFTVGYRRLYLTRRLPGQLGGLLNAGDLYFHAAIDGQAVGDPTQRVRATWIMEFPNADRWRRSLDIPRARNVNLRLQVFENRAISSDTRHADIGITLTWPYQAGTFMNSAGPFIVEWYVIEGRPGDFTGAAPGEVTACRGAAGSTSCTTVSSRSFTARVEIHPVRPCPTGTDVPNRPPGLTGGAWENQDATDITATSDLNCIPNPSVIPILSTRDSSRLRREAARIECTYYRPDSLNFTDNDIRLEWSAETISGTPDIQFCPPAGGRAARGLKVFVYGRPTGRNPQGEVRLRVRFRGGNIAEYRALVRPILQLPYRVNILNGGRRANPRVTPALALQHIQVANRFFRQVGIELIPDTSLTIGHMPAGLASRCTVTTTDHVGIFRIAVPSNLTRRVGGTDPEAALLNYRPNVLNICYVHSLDGGYLGWAVDFRGRGDTVTDNGRPSSSWRKPSGVAPDGNPGSATMRLFGNEQRAGHPDLWASLIANSNGNPRSDQLTYGGSIAHELGHVFGLRHRVGAGQDTLLFPPLQNVMHGDSPSTIAQDFDLIQRIGLEASPYISPRL